MANPTFNEVELNFDWSEAETHCWKCGRDMGNRLGKLERCHIIPAALGGVNEPYNFVLLCSNCHSLAPNINNSSVMWDWLKVSVYAKFSLYNTFNVRLALEMYEREFGHSLFDDASKQEGFMDRLREACGNISDHSSVINASTLYYLMISLRE